LAQLGVRRISYAGSLMHQLHELQEAKLTRIAAELDQIGREGVGPHLLPART
jgi:hypothetical protein